jgi:hypothetical protein
MLHALARPSVRALAIGAAALAVSLLAPAPAAYAGSAYWCTCKGVNKRYIASTHHCEVHKFELAHGKGAEIPAGWVKKHSCMAADHRRWQSEACREMGCTLPKH